MVRGYTAHLERHHICWKVYTGFRAIYASIHHVFLRHILAIQCYTAYKIYYCSMALYLKVLNWSACSPHLLPNWKHLAHHETKNKTKKTQDWLRQEWDNIALPEIQQLVFSVPRHLLKNKTKEGMPQFKKTKTATTSWWTESIFPFSSSHTELK